MSRSQPKRRGFALLAVLWVLASIAVLAALLERTAQESLGATRNRVDAVRATWENEGCLAMARAIVDGQLTNAKEPEEAWARVDELLTTANQGFRCNVSARPTGLDAAVPGGEPGRILLTRAPLEVLRTLPGMSAEAAALLVERRGNEPINLLKLATELPREAADSLRNRLVELQTLATTEPDAWILTSRTRRDKAGRTTSVEVRLVRSGRRSAIMRHRSSPWS